MNFLRILSTAAALVFASACGAPESNIIVEDKTATVESVLVAEAPKAGLTGSTTFVVHYNTEAEFDSVLSAVTQVQVAVPFKLTVVQAGPVAVEGNVWHVYFNQPCGLELSPTLDLCDPMYDAATDVGPRQSTWISIPANDNRSIVAHEIGHAVGHHAHTEDGVMATPSVGEEEFSDSDLATIKALYQ